MAETQNNDVLVGMQIQLGEIKGILNTIVTEHARRISDLDKSHVQMRFDLTAIKTEAKKDVGDLAEKLNNMAIKSHEDGGKILQELNKDITTNKNNIAELRGDIIEVKDKQNAGFGKVVMILSPILAFVALLWNILGK